MIANAAGLNADLRRFQADEESRRLGVLAQRVVVESEQVELERLEYLFRRGRWEQVLRAVPPLEESPGPAGARATR